MGGNGSNGTSLTFEEVADLFRTLGVHSFGAALPEGQIHWLDANGSVVAHARCEAILSHANGNSSVMWARGIRQLADAGVPTVEPPSEVPEYMEGIDAARAEALAAESAGRAGAQFLYGAPTGGGTLFLAVFEFAPGGLADDPAIVAHREADARRRVTDALTLVAGLLGGPGQEDAASRELDAFTRVLRQQATFVLKGLSVADRVTALADRVSAWREALPAGRELVLADVGRALEAWR